MVKNERLVTIGLGASVSKKEDFVREGDWKYSLNSLYMGHKNVCLACQKAINLNADYAVAEKQSMKCSDCGGVMIRYSHRFRPPAKNANKKWEVVRFLHQNGFHFHHVSEVGKNGYSKYPETMKEAEDFVSRLKS